MLAVLPALVLASCSPGGAMLGPQQVPMHEATRAVPQAQACPAAGAVMRSGKASAKVVKYVAWGAGKPIAVKWIVDFKNLTQAEFDKLPTFVPRLRACGVSNTAIGSLGGASSKTHRGSCSNGVCTAVDTYEQQYLPPPRRLGQVRKFDLIVFAPQPPGAPYGPMRAVLVQVNR